MKIKNFKYNKDGVTSERELIVTEESSNYLAGYDLSHLKTDEEKIAARRLTESLNIEEYDKFDPDVVKQLKKLPFRKFLKSKIVGE